jgi:hypothetical protein
MPYYFGEGDPNWDETGDGEPIRFDYFHYLPAPDIGGAPEPVRFSDQPPLVAPEPAAAPAAPRPGLLDRLLGRPQTTSPPVVRPTWQQQRAEQQRRGQHVLALLVVALREIGARRVYCRYDGGNDEGFSWLDHVEMRDGDRLAARAVAEALVQTPIMARLTSAGLGREMDDRLPLDQLLDLTNYVLASECAALLLGNGFGTGPYYLYGAFTMDLDTCTIADDRNAAAEVQNIEVEA